MQCCSADRICRGVSAGLVAAFVLVMTGCGSSATVTGKVTYKDQPLPTGTVTIHGEGGKTAAGSIDDGKYTVEKAPVGPVKITVTVQAGPQRDQGFMKGMKDASEHPMPGAPKKAVPIPTKYGAPDSSGLATTLNKGKQEYNITLQP